MYGFEVFEIVNLIGFTIGILFGAVAQKTQFCFSGSIKDYILMKSTKRASSVIVAIIIAIFFTAMISHFYDIDLKESQYLRENINYFSLILGGFLFGIGMMLADGCSNRQLIKFAQGDINSLITIIFIGIFALATSKGFIYNNIIDFTNNKTLLYYSSLIGNFQVNIYILLSILLVIFTLLLKKFKRILNVTDGIFIGLLISFSWFITGILGEESIERIIPLSGISFVYPTSKTIELFSSYEISELTFPISIILGIILGAFLMSKVNKKYSFACATSNSKNRVKYNIIGGSMMGTGGVLSLGCTVGQGITGLSTLALASLVSIVSILVSAIITAIILNKKENLPLCFIFEWKDNTVDYQI